MKQCDQCEAVSKDRLPQADPIWQGTVSIAHDLWDLNQKQKVYLGQRDPCDKHVDDRSGLVQSKPFEPDDAEEEGNAKQDGRAADPEAKYSGKVVLRQDWVKVFCCIVPHVRW